MYTNLILVSFSVTVCLLHLYLGTTNNATVTTDSTEEPITKSEKGDLSIVIIGGAATGVGGIIMMVFIVVVCALCFCWYECYYKKQLENMKSANEYEMK